MPTGRDLRLEMSEALQDLMRAWFPRVIDSARGGYVEHLDHEWKPAGDARRSLVHQARLVWSAAAFGQHDEPHRDEFTSYALHGIRSIDRVFRDNEHGGFYFDVDENNQPARDGEKHTYALAFAMFAGAKAYALTGDDRAISIAEISLEWLKQHSLRADGTYYEELERDGTHKTSAPSSIIQTLKGRKSKNPLGDEYGYATLNTHMHVLEALTELYKARASAEVKNLVEQLIDVLASVCHDASRIPVRLKHSPERAGFGHSVELAYLLLDAGRAIGSSRLSEVESLSRNIALSVLENGRDTSNGGIFDRPAIDNGAKIWWVQAEALNTWIAMYQLDQDPLWIRAAEDQWAFIRDHMIDRQNGGWITRIPGGGQKRRLSPKSDAWTDPYHQVRALINGSGL